MPNADALALSAQNRTTDEHRWTQMQAETRISRISTDAAPGIRDNPCNRCLLSVPIRVHLWLK